MSNPAAPSANVKDKIKRGPRIEYSDVEEDVIDHTGQSTNKRGTGANGQKIIHGKTTPSTAAISTPKVSINDPPKTSTTPKEVDLKDPKPQGQDSSGSSTAMSATNTNVQDNGNVLDSSNSSSDTQRNNTPILTAVKRTDNDKTSDTSKTKADQKGDTPGTIASVEQDNGNVPDISNSSSGTQINNMSTLTAVVTHDNDKTYDISKTSVGNNTPDNILVANKVRANDDESVRTRHSVDKSIDASTMTDDNVSRDQTITNLGMTKDKPSSIDTNGETYPAVTLATDGVETKSWSNQQITYRYVAVMLVVMGLFVPSVLCCFQNGWPSTSQSAEANLGESRHEDVHIEIANIKHRIEKEVSLRIETQNKFQQKVEDVDRSLEHMLEAVQKLTSTPKEIEGSIKQTTATVKQISRLASSLSNLEKSVRETNETTLALGRKAEGRDMRIEMLAAELGDVHQEIERKMMDVYSKLQETLKDKVDKMDNSQDIAKGQLNIVFKNIEKTDTLVAVVLAIVIIQVAQFFLFWKRIAPN